MSGRLIDLVDGVATVFHYDETEDKTIIEVRQDVEPVLDKNKALYNADDKGWSPTRELRRVASIPVVVIEKWRREDGIDVFNPDHKEAVRRKLNSNEYLYLRTAPGRL